MKANQLLKKIKKMIKKGNIIDNIDYIWNELVEDMLSLSDEELREVQYPINQIIIEYFISIINQILIQNRMPEYRYKIDEILSIGGTAAYDSQRDIIYLSILRMILDSVNTTSYMQTLLHEYRHKIQHQFYKEKNIKDIEKYPPHMILIAKHYAYEKFHEENNRIFYRENYNKLYSEIDAEEYSIKIIKDAITHLRHPIKKQIKKDIEEIEEILRKEKRIDTETSKELLKEEPILSTWTVEKEKKDSLIVVDKFIKTHPEIIEVVPILQILWKEDKIKTYEDLMTEKKQCNNSIIFDYIIKSDPMLQLSEYIEENNIEKIRFFLMKHPQILDEYKDDIIDFLEKKEASNEIKELFHLTKQKKKSNNRFL